MPRVIHFDLTAQDPERAIKFYSGVFGWEIEKYDSPEDYWVMTTGQDDEPGINGGLMRRGDTEFSAAYSIEVPSIDDFINRVKEHGGTVVGPKAIIPGVGYFAYCEDTENNTFGIIQWDAAAK